jgi:hypothetical protein
VQRTASRRSDHCDAEVSARVPCLLWRSHGAPTFGATIPAVVDDDPLPRARGLAPSLNGARPGQVIIVDERGDVAPASVLVARRLKIYAVMFAGAFALGCVGAFVLGPAGALVAPVVAVVATRLWFRRGVKLGQALERLAADDLAEAERLAREAARTASSALVRGNAWSVVGSVVWLRGDAEEGLAWTRRALGELERTRHRGARPIIVATRLNEIQLLAITDRGEEARAVLDRLEASGELGEGDLIAAHAIDTRLVLAFETDDPEALPADLHAWTQAMLATQRFGSAVALLAWAHHRRAEPELGDALLDVARSRLPECHLHHAQPRLHAWVQTHTP